MRSYRGDLTAVVAIVVGALGSFALYQRGAWSRTRDLGPATTRERFVIVHPVRRTPGAASGLVIVGPDRVVRPVKGMRTLHFSAAEPEGGVYLIRPGLPDKLIVPGTEIQLGDGLFDGTFRTHGVPRKMYLQVELLSGDRVTQKASVSSLIPHVDVTRRGVSVFGF